MTVLQHESHIIYIILFDVKFPQKSTELSFQRDTKIKLTSQKHLQEIFLMHY